MLNYIAIVIFIIFSAFFSSSEIAYAASNELRLKHSAENGGKASKLAYKIYCKYEDALATILVGNNLVNIAASSVATVIVVGLLGESWSWLSTLAITVLLLIFGEILPKVVVKTIPGKVAYIYAVPLYTLMIITAPIVFIVNLVLKLVAKLWKKGIDNSPTVTEDELETIIDTVEDEGIIDEEKCDLIQSVFDFDEVQAYEIITPRVDMLAIDADDDREDIIKKVMSSPFSRIPVYRDTIDNIIGVLHVNTALKALSENSECNLLAELKPAVFVHKTNGLDDVLRAMQKQKIHLAVVTDEYGGVMGIITMEDVLEQLVGDIWDESDVIDPEFVELKDNEYEISGDMRTTDMFYEIDFEDKDFDDDNATVGGFVTELLGRYARKNDRAEYKNLLFEVIRVKGIRIVKLKVTVLEISDDDQEEE